MTLNKRIEYLRKEGLVLLKKLISIPSTSPDGEHYQDIIFVLKQFLDKHNIKYEVVKVPIDYQKKNCASASSNPRYILKALAGKGDLWLELNGHYDVVPGGPGWSVTKPFEPKQMGSLIYGRGATDMKGGLVSMALATIALRDSEDIKLTSVFVPDEEIGGECGTGYHVKTWVESKPNYVVIAEPSTTKNVWIGHKGGLWIKVVVKGKTAHASTPWMGKNAFTAAAKIVNYFEKNYEPTLKTRLSKYEYDFPQSKNPTVMIGGEAGVPDGKTNQVPGEAYFTIDRRLVIEEEASKVEDEVNKVINEAVTAENLQEYNVETSILTKMNPVFTCPGNKLSNAIMKAAVEIGLEKPREIVCTGGLDLRYYINEGVKGVSYGPGVPGVEHAPNEYTDYEAIVQVAKIYSLLPSKLV